MVVQKLQARNSFKAQQVVKINKNIFTRTLRSVKPTAFSRFSHTLYGLHQRVRLNRHTHVRRCGAEVGSACIRQSRAYSVASRDTILPVLFAYYKHVIDSYNNEVSAQLNSTHPHASRVCPQRAIFLLYSPAVCSSHHVRVVHGTRRGTCMLVDMFIRILLGVFAMRCNAHCLYLRRTREKSYSTRVAVSQSTQTSRVKNKRASRWVPIIVRRRETVARRRCRPLMWKVRGDKYGAV